MTTYTVLLEDGTIGTVSDDTLDGQHPDAFIGEVLNVHLHDEDGNPIEACGVLTEVLA